MYIVAIMDSRPVMTPIPVLQTCFSRSWGGLEIQALEVTSQLVKRAYPVTLACCTGSRLASEARAAGLRVIEFDVSGYFHPAALVGLSRYIRAHSPKIIHCQHSRTSPSSSPPPACRAPGPAYS